MSASGDSAFLGVLDGVVDQVVPRLRDEATVVAQMGPVLCGEPLFCPSSGIVLYWRLGASDASVGLAVLSPRSWGKIGEGVGKGEAIHSQV